MRPTRRIISSHAPTSAYGRIVTAVTAWVEHRPRLADALFAGALASVAVAAHLAATPSGSEQDPDLMGVALVACAHLVLAFRRQRPLIVLGIVAATTWVFWVSDYATTFEGAMLVALYSVMAHEPNRRRAWLGAGTLVGGSALVVLTGIISEVEDVGFASLAAIVAALSVAAAIGDSMWNRRAYLAEVEARAELAEAERRHEAQRAVTDERNRIARELHDVVAHSMSVMVVQAGAARRVLATEPDRAADVLQIIEATGRESMAEMRRIVGVLRNGSTPGLEPQPDLTNVGDLVDRCRDAGMDVRLRCEGPIDALPAGLSLAGYRVVQEGLTNVFKHAGPATASVAVEVDAHRLALEILDDGRGASTAFDDERGGHGLVGMQERIALYGGTLTVGPRRDGGFAVRADIPLGPRGRAAADTATADAGRAR